MQKIDWIRGDSTGLHIPAHSDALAVGGVDFLTQAFRTASVIGIDNSVQRITECREVQGGSTGRKLLLAVEYAKPLAALHTQLFVKFSRDFDSERRDAARVQMEREVQFAMLSSDPNFPVVVPKCYFSDFHHESGTGILITQRIPFGKNSIEPQYPKGMDYQMPDQLGHYRALITALARLAGTHKAGLLAPMVEQYFPFTPDKLGVSEREPYTPDQIRQKVADYAAFARQYPQLLPENIRSDVFLVRLAEQAPRFQSMLPAVNKILKNNSNMIALCHWNAHVDNAWFWSGEKGAVECGLMDWGNVSQMNLAMAIWGCLSAAELDIWNEHLDELLVLFITEFERCGGPRLERAEFKTHLLVYIAMMGLAWMLDSVKYIPEYLPQLSDAKARLDPMVQTNERARSQLIILSAFLNLWEREEMNAVLEYMQQFEC